MIQKEESSSVLTLAVGLGTALGQSGVPEKMPVKGALPKKVNGVMMPGMGNVVEITFGVYTGAEGGAMLWSERQAVTLGANRTYGATLGQVTPMDVSLFERGDELWLGVTAHLQRKHRPEKNVEIFPRQPLLPISAYAFKARYAEEVVGRVAVVPGSCGHGELMVGISATGQIICQCLGTGETALTWYRDADDDGYGVTGDAVLGCDKPSGYVAQSGDCMDTNAQVHPGQTAYFPAHRGDGSFDYNCDGQDDLNPNDPNPGAPPPGDCGQQVSGGCYRPLGGDGSGTPAPEQCGAPYQFLARYCDRMPCQPVIACFYCVNSSAPPEVVEAHRSCR
jgi:hypothetical protein